jgi:pimeloyl-ACP methyl ester carboxylesterase
MPAETPTIVLVHGAWADATGFDAEIRALQRGGFRAIGFANPLRDLAGDAAYLAEFLRTVTGPIVLVGHSYGGNVISKAASGNEQVQALVFFNGWMCDEGESQQELLERFEGSLVGPSIRPVPFTNPDGSEGADLFLDPEAFREAFAADIDPRHGCGDGCGAAAICRRRVRSHAVGPAGVEDTPVLVSAWHRGQGDPAGAAAVHGRARKRDDRGGAGFTRLICVAVRSRDPAHPSGRRGNVRSAAVTGATPPFGFTFNGAYGEGWVSSTTTAGERLAAPRHHIAAVVYDDDGEHEDCGFG